MLEGVEDITGPAAAVATSVLWTGTTLFFTAASKRLGPTVVNAARIFLAVGLLAATHKLWAGTWLPQAHFGQVVFLAASGIVGLTLGDQALFTAYLDIGPRMAMLIMTTSPLFAALFGWVVLGETLHSLAWLGIALTLCGVGWVVRERPRGREASHQPHRRRGIILAFVAAACQAGGLLLSKQGMGHGWLPEDQHLDPQAATLLRMVFAALGILPILALHAARERRHRANDMTPVRLGFPAAGLSFMVLGTIFGPYLGVWMSLVASDLAPLGIAQTLCSLSPIFLLPLVAVIYKEQVSRRAVTGAFIAVGGSALLFIQ